MTRRFGLSARLSSGSIEAPLIDPGHRSSDQGEDVRQNPDEIQLFFYSRFTSSRPTPLFCLGMREEAGEVDTDVGVRREGFGDAEAFGERNQPISPAVDQANGDGYLAQERYRPGRR